MPSSFARCARPRTEPLAPRTPRPHATPPHALVPCAARPFAPRGARPAPFRPCGMHPARPPSNDPCIPRPLRLARLRSAPSGTPHPLHGMPPIRAQRVPPVSYATRPAPSEPRPSRPSSSAGCAPPPSRIPRTPRVGHASDPRGMRNGCAEAARRRRARPTPKPRRIEATFRWTHAMPALDGRAMLGLRSRKGHRRRERGQPWDDAARWRQRRESGCKRARGRNRRSGGAQRRSRSCAPQRWRARPSCPSAPRRPRSQSRTPSAEPATSSARTPRSTARKAATCSP